MNKQTGEKVAIKIFDKAQVKQVKDMAESIKKEISLKEAR